MRRSIILGLATLMASVATAQQPSIATAQELSRVEVFAGWEMFRNTPSARANVIVTPLSNFRANGAQASVQFNVNSYIGVVGEFGANRTGGVALCTSGVGMDQTQFLYLFGPRMFVHATSRISPFMEFLAGGVRDSRVFAVPNTRIDPTAVMPPGVTAETGTTTTRFHTTQNAFATAIGAGVDVGVTRTMAVRPLQVDCVGTRLAPLSVPGVPAGINDSRWQVNWKYSAGVTFRFGGMRRGDEREP